jgi:hypothetical protein
MSTPIFRRDHRGARAGTPGEQTGDRESRAPRAKLHLVGSFRRPLSWSRLEGARPIDLLAAAVFLAVMSLWAFEWTPIFIKFLKPNLLVGVDFTFYMDATRRFLAGGPFYESWQLTGTYGRDSWPVLYPPQAIVLFAPFTVLPPILWWAMPLLTIFAVVAWQRPGPLVWPLLALCLWWPETTIKTLAGNPIIWAAAAVALGTIWRWPAALALIKPSLFPLALIGARDRRWWLVAAAGALPFAWMLPDYLRALGNFQVGLGYSIQEVPLLLIPLLAWLGSTRVGPPPSLPFHSWSRRPGSQ